MNDRRTQLLELLDRSGPGLHTLLTRLTLRADVAEDLLQELFIKLSQADDLDKVKNLDAYARTAAVHLAFDWRRHRHRLSLPLDAVDEPIAADDSPLDALECKDQFEAVLDAMTTLSDDQRDVITMRFIEGRSHEQTAAAMGKTTHHVRAVCSRGLHRLRETLRTDRIKTTKDEVTHVDE